MCRLLKLAERKPRRLRTAMDAGVRVESPAASERIATAVAAAEDGGVVAVQRLAGYPNRNSSRRAMRARHASRVPWRNRSR